MPKSAQQCLAQREEMRQKILRRSMLYFARNGFSGTKMSDLARHIGIGQGTVYLYFTSKEDLFQEVFRQINQDQEVEELRMLTSLPVPAAHKIHELSKALLSRLEQDESYAAKVVLNTQMLFETKDYIAQDTTYQSNLYHATAAIIRQGQQESSVVEGSALKLSDYFWGVVYLYALKKLFTTQYESITAHDLSRILLKEEKTV